MHKRLEPTRRTALRLAAAGCIGGALSPAFGQRAAGEARRQVDVSLALAVDASGSVNEKRFEMQKRGYVEAFKRAELLQAIRSGQHRCISVSMYQWTGPGLQAIVVPWTGLDDQASLQSVADRVAGSTRRLSSDGTSISGAIDYGAHILSNCPFDGARQVLDISGDGANNSGRPPDQARDDALNKGIVINGLPILALEPDLAEHYSRSVIGGPGAFVVVAGTFEDFGEAILRKLIMEIAAIPSPGAQQG